MTTVVVVDDQVLVRQAVVDILDSAENIEVVGAAADGLEAVDMAASLQPDIVLMDIRMPRLDGIEATQRICADAANTNSRVLILKMNTWFPRCAPGPAVLLARAQSPKKSFGLFTRWQMVMNYCHLLQRAASSRSTCAHPGRARWHRKKPRASWHCLQKENAKSSN